MEGEKVEERIWVQWDKRGLMTALDLLQKSRQEKEAQYAIDIAELDHTISILREHTRAIEQQQLAANDVKKPTRDGRLKGVKLREAMQLVLAKHGAPMPFPQLVMLLDEAGVNLGSRPKRKAANVKTTVANNPTRFKYTKTTDLVELAAQ